MLLDAKFTVLSSTSLDSRLCENRDDFPSQKGQRDFLLPREIKLNNAQLGLNNN